MLTFNRQPQGPVLSNFSGNMPPRKTLWHKFRWIIFVVVFLILAGLVLAGFALVKKLAIPPIDVSAPESSIPQVTVAESSSSVLPTNPTVYDYTQAPQHIGQTVGIRGQVLHVYTDSKGDTFLDFCQSDKNCPFTAVIFKNFLSKFSPVSQYNDKILTIIGTLQSYNGSAEISISYPNQIQK